MITMVNRLTLVLSQANRFLAFSRVILNHETDFFVIVETPGSSPTSWQSVPPAACRAPHRQPRLRVGSARRLRPPRGLEQLFHRRRSIDRLRRLSAIPSLKQGKQFRFLRVVRRHRFRQGGDQPDKDGGTATSQELGRSRRCR